MYTYLCTPSVYLLYSIRQSPADMFSPLLYRADDLIPEESEVVLLALKRLPPKEAYDRVFRMRRAFQVRPLILSLPYCPTRHESSDHCQSQCSISHQLLPQNEQTKPDEVRSVHQPLNPTQTLTHLVHPAGLPLSHSHHQRNRAREEGETRHGRHGHHKAQVIDDASTFSPERWFHPKGIDDESISKARMREAFACTLPQTLFFPSFLHHVAACPPTCRKVVYYTAINTS